MVEIVEIVNIQGNVVKRSQNLRGILDYARQEPVVHIYLEHLERGRGGEGVVHFEFYNGATSIVRFADSTVAHQWILSRRSWGQPDVIDEGSSVQYVYE